MVSERTAQVPQNRLLISAIFLTSTLLAPYAQRVACAADGDLDPRFGVSGKVTTDFATSFDNGSAVAIQSDGKLVVVGANFDGIGGADFAVARYNVDGSLDASFGTGGKVLTDFGRSYDQATAVAIQLDGKIVVVGRTQTGGSNDDFALVRYNADGSLDATFGVGGKVHTDLGATFFERANAVVIQIDGKIIAAGETNSAGRMVDTTDFALVRYNADGSIDTTFGGGGNAPATGIVITDFGDTNDQVFALALQADGKIVAVGSTAPVVSGAGTGTDFALARYNKDGSVDSSFGTTANGLVTTDLSGAGGSDIAHAIAIQNDGKIIAAGESLNNASGTGTDFALVRYTIDGTLDATFGSGGAVLTNFSGSSTDQAFGVGLQTDGKIVASGFVFIPNVEGNGDFGVARYNTDGSLDPSFGASATGLVTTDFSVTFDSAMGMAIQADGNIVVVGSTFGRPTVGGADFALARYQGTPPPQTLTLFLHTNDTPGTAGGFTMNQTEATPNLVWLAANGDPSWFSDPTITGTFLAGATFRLELPCTSGLMLPHTVTLAATDPTGTKTLALGQASAGLTICLGQDSVSMTVPITTPVMLASQRLKLTITWTSNVNVPLTFGKQAYLQATNLAGAP